MTSFMHDFTPYSSVFKVKVNAIKQEVHSLFLTYISQSEIKFKFVGAAASGQSGRPPWLEEEGAVVVVDVGYIAFDLC